MRLKRQINTFISMFKVLTHLPLNYLTGIKKGYTSNTGAIPRSAMV